MINTNKTFDGKPIDESKTYEENCLAQIDEITTVVEPKPYTQEQYDYITSN